MDHDYIAEEDNEDRQNFFVLHGNKLAQQFVKNLFSYFRERHPELSALQETATALHISPNTVRKYKDGPQETTEKLTRKRKKCLTDDLTETARIDVKHEIYDMYAERSPVDLNSLLFRLRTKEKYFGSKTSLFKLLKRMGFSYRKDDNRRTLMEKPHIASLRRQFLKRYMENESLGPAKKPCVFLDETWIFSNGSFRRSWQDDDERSVRKDSGEGNSDDSTPGAIRIPGIATDPETLKNNGSMEESQDSQMRRYLFCPGMCRVEVLKKFVRNKYNVDTNQFFIDVLYKRVPLPDHYTLIDIAYIYSWQRNELMKFFFRIIDRIKAKRTDSPVDTTPKFVSRNFRRSKSSGKRAKRETTSDKKSNRKSFAKAAKQPSHHEIKRESNMHDKNARGKMGVKSEVEDKEQPSENAKSKNLERIHSPDDIKSDPPDKIVNSEFEKQISARTSFELESSLDKVVALNKKSKESSKNDNKSCGDGEERFAALKLNKSDKENKVVSKKVDKEFLSNDDVEVPIDHKQKNLIDNMDNIVTKVEKSDSFGHDEQLTKVVVSPDLDHDVSTIPTIKKEPISPEAQKADNKLILKVSKEFLDNVIAPKPQIFSKPVTKSYTSITLNRSENVEIITKIEPVSNRDGQSIGHHIIKQTIKKGSKIKSNSPKKLSGKGQVTIPRLVITKKGIKKKASPKREIKSATNGIHSTNTISKTPKREIDNDKVATAESKALKLEAHIDDEKSEFLKYMNLTPTASLPIKNATEQQDPSQLSPPIKKESAEPTSMPPKRQIIISRAPGGQKRKNNSPIKNEKAKISKIEGKKSVKLILQERPSSSQASAHMSLNSKDVTSDTGLRTLISSCKIPSSLSITIKESSEKDSFPLVVPPVKNYIEILKLPEESSVPGDRDKSPCETKCNEPTKLDLSKFCDNDSEQKVDQDLSEIAKSLTEKIPMSTTISQIVGPKQQFQIPVKTNISPKAQIQPAPVPDINKAVSVATSSKENLVKLSPRSPQTFQKIFEESLKKPPEGPKTSAIELPAISDPNVPSSSGSSSSSSSSSSKRNILEIASQLFKKTKLEHDKKVDVTLPKVPIPRLPNSRTQKTSVPQPAAKLVPQTVASLHSTSLGMNYTVSVDQQSPSKVMKSNGIVSPVKAESVPGVPECKPSVSPSPEMKSNKTDFKVPSPSLGSPKLPEVSSASRLSPRPKSSPKHSPKSSPLVKHMYAPTVPMFNQKVPFAMNRFASLSPKPQTTSKPGSISPRQSSPSAKPSTSPKVTSPTPSSSAATGNASLSANEILEKYNIQNLAQLTASFNLSPSVLASNQLAAFQHAMLLKHIEMQNRQNWLNRNQGPLMQYEKYLQSLNGGINGSHSQT